MAISMLGVGKIMFGTDIPLREDIELQRRDIETLDLTAAELDDIYADSAAPLLVSRLWADRSGWFFAQLKCCARGESWLNHEQHLRL